MNRVLMGILGLAVVIVQVLAEPAPALETLRAWIDQGRWQEARGEIDRQLALSPPFLRQQELLFQKERMRRIRLDFPLRREDVLLRVRSVVPDIDEATFTKWEQAGSLENLQLDGDTWYFARAAENLFRVNPEAKVWRARHRPAEAPISEQMRDQVRDLIHACEATQEPLNTAKRMRIRYGLQVRADLVPAGEVVRAWLPFPQSGGRQSAVRLVSTVPDQTVRSPSNAPLACVYLEAEARAGQPTRFEVVFEYTSRAVYQPLDPARVRPVNTRDASLALALAERPPHLRFTPEMRALSREIVGAETHPLRVAQKLFAWISENIPWASAREYSTLESLSDYARQHRWGDCGIQTLLFMTLCRLNGIPAQWESGWITRPQRNMHDWCRIYLEPYGWVPVDCSHGLMDSPDPRLRWFYLGNLDNERLVVNTDYEQPLFPVKMHCRSEFVDFQRGEVEWRGGNLYFDAWSWDFQVESPASSP